jgi:hypothetical protein
LSQRLREKVDRDALERFGREKFGVKELDDWYSVLTSEVFMHSERSILQKYGSLLNALKTLYPQHNWDPLRFSKVPNGYWTEDAQREALERLGREHFGVKELDDWYSVPSTNVHSELSFLKRYGSLFNALKALYPHHNWNPLRFSRMPTKCWTEDTQRYVLERVGREHFGVKELDDWYAVSAEDVKKELSFIGNYYNSSLYNALKTLYPQHNWDPLRFSRVSRGYWTENAQRAALERVGREQFGVKELDDWYSVPATSVRHELSFVQKYGSLFDALKKFYPQHNWDPLRFSRIPTGSWANENVQREALESFAKEKFGVKELDDWYSVPIEDVKSRFGFIQSYYNGSLFEALKKLYPYHNWDPARFPIGIKAYRTDENTKREALERLGEKLGVKELDDWYSVSASVVHQELGFMKKYRSLFYALKAFYPQHNWDPLRFPRAPSGYWQQTKTVQHYRNMFINWKTTYNLRTIRDWYELPPQQVEQFKRAAQGIFGSKLKLLQEWFPEIVWHSQYTSQIELQVPYCCFV